MYGGGLNELKEKCMTHVEQLMSGSYGDMPSPEDYRYAFDKDRRDERDRQWAKASWLERMRIWFTR